MLSRDGVIARFIFVFCFYFVSCTGMVRGGIATICGILGTVFLASVLLRYSPLVEFLTLRADRKKKLKT